MALINLKFSPEMEELILQGKKCCTTRDEVKGDSGDIFVVKNRVYRIISVWGDELLNISSLFHLEGFYSTDEFLDCLYMFYPELDETCDVWIHFFAYIGDWCPQFGVIGAACSNPEEFCELYSDCVKARG